MDRRGGRRSGSRSQVRRDDRRRLRRHLAVGCGRRRRSAVKRRQVVLDDEHGRVASTSHGRVADRRGTAAAAAAADAGATAEARHHLRRQHLAEARVEDGVDRKVDGRVGDDQHVADAAVVELEAAADARVVVQDVPEDLVEQRRRLADAEDDDDDDQDQRDVVVLRLAHALHTHTVQTVLTRTRMHYAVIDQSINQSGLLH